MDAALSKLEPTDDFPDAAEMLIAESDRKQSIRDEKAAWYERYAYVQEDDAYFDLIDQRLPGHGHDVEALRQRRILIDGAPETGGGLLLQIFTENMVGPIFFEIIQRKGNDGFGEGNFKALFESLELDQIRRGVIPAGVRAA